MRLDRRPLMQQRSTANNHRGSLSKSPIARFCELGRLRTAKLEVKLKLGVVCRRGRMFTPALNCVHRSPSILVLPAKETSKKFTPPTIGAKEQEMFKKSLLAAVITVSLIFGAAAQAAQTASPEDIAIALSLARLLQAARSIISANQALINNPDIGDKGLTGNVVLAAAIKKYMAANNADPRSLDPQSRAGRLLDAEMEAIKEVTNENQSFINNKGVGFKAFIPAVFGRLVTERLREKVGSEAEIKVTAPPALVRNRKVRPDNWEKSVIETKFMSPDWPRGQIYAEEHPNKGRDALRVMVPEYYAASCLSCHGEKKGEIDITGYPKEGGHKGELGGVISITLFDAKQ